MDTTPPLAETRAAEAQTLPAFRHLNLYGIKSAIKEILQLVGRDGIFREYTLHDVTHVDQMLGILDWLIPTATQEAMTPADWLLIVLAVYFHDAGMVVTPEEFSARADSDFNNFCERELFAGHAGAEYRAKLGRLEGEEAERFAYEEFIRRNHAERVADWIQGRHTQRRGLSTTLANQIDELLRPLPAEFRRDLALVCESHHQSDLHNTTKYKLSQPYGNSESETANVQYAALMLRTADLLHLTSDRTPTVMFRLINFQDPVSQREWSKQAAVRRVRAQKGHDREGNQSDGAAKSCIEVFATFADAEGFFGLTSYLRYAEGELLQTFEWAETSRTEAGNKYYFPWRRIDDSEVTATGFLPERLGFPLDQEKILELLTGHTLYNDTQRCYSRISAKRIGRSAVTSAYRRASAV